MQEQENDKCREIVFLETVKALMPVCGISAIPEAVKYFDMLTERVMADLEARKVGASFRKSEEANRKEAFVKIFLELFEKQYNRKYNIEISVKEITVIAQITESLFLEQIPARMYLEWCFGELMSSGNFDMASILLFGSQKIFLKFMISKKDEIDSWKAKQVKEEDAVVLRDLFRKCVRELREQGPEGLEKIKILQEKGTQFKTGYLHIDDFRKFIFGIQDEIEKMKKA
jgi:hypothetical protein